MKFIKAKRALYIKLGENGAWEENVITKEGVPKIEFSDVKMEDCQNGNWNPT